MERAEWHIGLMAAGSALVGSLFGVGGSAWVAHIEGQQSVASEVRQQRRDVYVAIARYENKALVGPAADRSTLSADGLNLLTDIGLYGSLTAQARFSDFVNLYFTSTATNNNAPTSADKAKLMQLQFEFSAVARKDLGVGL